MAKFLSKPLPQSSWQRTCGIPFLEHAHVYDTADLKAEYDELLARIGPAPEPPRTDDEYRLCVLRVVLRGEGVL